MTDRALDFDQSASIMKLRVILTDQSSRLTDITGDPVIDRAVVVVSGNPFLRFARSRHIQLAYPDLNRRYSIAGLPSGRYLVVLVEELYPGVLYTCENSNAIASIGTEAIIEAGTTATLDLTFDADAERLAGAATTLPLRTPPRLGG